MLEEGAFTEDWKTNNAVQVHKKDCKNLIKNYRPISLLPMLCKVFEMLKFNSMFNYFMEKKLLQNINLDLYPGSFHCNPPFDIKRTYSRYLYGF